MEIPRDLPIMILEGVTLFPGALLPLRIFEPRYLRMLNESLEGHRLYCVAQRKSHCQRVIPYGVAGLGLVRTARRQNDGTYHVVLQGLIRVQLGGAKRYRPLRVHSITPLQTEAQAPHPLTDLLEEVGRLARKRMNQGFGPGPEPGSSPPMPTGDTSPNASWSHMLDHLAKEVGPEQFGDLVSAMLVQDPEARQELLETLNLERRLQHLVSILRWELDSSP